MKRDADVIVVGAGISGAVAAIEAASEGARVVGIDAAEGFGGTARLAGGGACIPGTSMQRERGIDDTPDRAFADLAANGHVFNQEWARRYFEQANRDVFEWLGGLGVSFATLHHFEGDSVARFHRPLNGGAGLMASLWKHSQALGLDRCWRFGLRLIDLTIEDGAVTGVVCEDAAGRTQRLSAGAVVVAIGGFAANLDLVRRHVPRLAAAPRVLVGGGPGAHGQGIDILGRHGARLAHLDEIYCYATGVPDYQRPASDRGVVIRGKTSWIWLNRDGQRFHDESQMISGNVSVPRLLAQPGATGWAVFDDSMVPDITVDDHYVSPGSETAHFAALRHLKNSRAVRKATTLPELFRLAGIAGAGADATIADWHRLLSSGAALDPLTGRALNSLRPLTVPPFYAVQFFPIARKAMGGVQTDPDCRVLREGDDRTFRGLFAAGEIAGMAGGHVAGIKPLEGMMVGPSCFSGRIAGRHAARCARNRGDAF